MLAGVTSLGASTCLVISQTFHPFMVLFNVEKTGPFCKGFVIRSGQRVVCSHQPLVNKISKSQFY